MYSRITSCIAEAIIHTVLIACSLSPDTSKGIFCWRRMTTLLPVIWAFTKRTCVPAPTFTGEACRVMSSNTSHHASNVSGAKRLPSRQPVSFNPGLHPTISLSEPALTCLVRFLNRSQETAG
ncbi:unnamed protein product [Ixodes hexagonus]